MLIAVLPLVLVLGWAPPLPPLSGTWQSMRQGRDGNAQVTTWVFDANGTTFTGTVAGPQSIFDITDGKVAADQISFDVPDGYQPALPPAAWKGTIATGGITLERVLSGGGEGTAVTLHRVSNDTVLHLPAGFEHPPLPAFTPLPSNGLALTPPMGWNSWNRFAAKIDDKEVRGVADALVASGLRDAGYTYVEIDDTWEGDRDPYGNIQPNGRFPDMKALADYVHNHGLKLGLYSSPGPKTCGGYAGSYNHETQDAKTWAAWGVDAVRYEWCSAAAVYRPAEMPAAYERLALALRATGRDIVLSVSANGWLDPGTWAPEAGGNLWRTAGDLRDGWQSMADIGFSQGPWAKYGGPGHWNDPGVLTTGNGGMSAAEYRTQFSLWAMLAAPLIAGNDLVAMTPETKAILANREVIAIDQDKLGQPGACALQCGTPAEIWLRRLAGGYAVALINRGDAAVAMHFGWAELRLPNVPAQGMKVRDLWAHEDVAPGAGFDATVPAHGTILLLIH